MLREAARSLFRVMWNHMFHRRHRIKAKKAYENIIKQPGGTRLSRSLENNIKEYSIETFGSTYFAPWLYVYTAYRGEFIEGWIPVNYFGLVVMPVVNKKYSSIGDVKTLSRKILRTDLIPDLAYFINGSWFDVNGQEHNQKNIEDKLFESHEKVFIKLDRSNQGRGIIVKDRQSFNSQELSTLGDFVIQAPVNQADWFNEIITGSVTTLRIITVKVRGNSAIKRASHLRVGRTRSQFIIFGEALTIPIIDESGTLAEFATGPDWTSYHTHPDTGFKFEGQCIPQYKEAVRVCEQLHDGIPNFTVIGWDVAISNVGSVQILEWNTHHPGIKFPEAAIGPCFKGLGWEKLWRPAVER